MVDTGAVADGQTANDRDGRARLAPSDFSTARRSLSAGTRVGDLHVCPTCESELVYPVDWAPAERKAWNVDLRCPDCEWQGGGVYAQEIVDRFDEELDRGTEQLLADLPCSLGRTWRSRSSGSSPRSSAARSSPRTSRPPDARSTRGSAAI